MWWCSACRRHQLLRQGTAAAERGSERGSSASADRGAPTCAFAVARLALQVFSCFWAVAAAAAQAFCCWAAVVPHWMSFMPQAALSLLHALSWALQAVALGCVGETPPPAAATTRKGCTVIRHAHNEYMIPQRPAANCGTCGQVPFRCFAVHRNSFCLASAAIDVSLRHQASGTALVL